jgi:uncharacterized membrane protein HdeD (DUF308 family)
METRSNKTWTIVTGLLAIILGLLLIAMPGVTVATFVLLFAGYLILYGIVRLIDSLRAPEGSRLRLPWLILGAIAILGGLGLIFYPGISVVLLAYYIAFYALAVGVLEIMAGFGNQASTGRHIWLIIGGALSLLFGLYLLFKPALGLSLLVVFLGWYSLIYGVILIIHAFTNKPEALSY